MTQFTIYNMDVLDALKRIEKESVDCVITSPPYWGLRDYGVTGQIGLESHPQDWIKKMVEVSRGLKRVLKPTGSYWLNVGDTYFAQRPETGAKSGDGKPSKKHQLRGGGKSDGAWLQPKQKLLMPHRLAIALQDDGWVLRNDVVWHKPSHMPSSVRDRLTCSFEFVFHFVKQRKYFYDLDAIREKHYSESSKKRWGKAIDGEGMPRTEQKEWWTKNGFTERTYNPSGKNPGDAWKNVNERSESLASPRARASRGNFDEAAFYHEGGKNPGDFWAVNPAPYPEAHFACFPPALVEKPLKATCPKQVCKACGKARERITKPTEEYAKHLGGQGFNPKDKNSWKEGQISLGKNYSVVKREYETLGWSDCGCGKGWQAGVVLDPFVGSGTTLAVAQSLGLRGIGIELNAEYIPLIRKRLLGDATQQSLNPDKLEVVEAKPKNEK